MDIDPTLVEAERSPPTAVHDADGTERSTAGVMAGSSDVAADPKVMMSPPSGRPLAARQLTGTGSTGGHGRVNATEVSQALGPGMRTVLGRTQNHVAGRSKWMPPIESSMSAFEGLTVGSTVGFGGGNSFENGFATVVAHRLTCNSQ